MAVKSRSVSVGDTPTRLDSGGNNARSIAPYNNGASTVFLGGSDVTTANGLPVPASSWGPEFGLKSGETLYGIVSTGTVELRVAETGV